MSALLELIRADQVAARKAKDTFAALALTTLLGESSPSGNDTVTDEQVAKVVQKFLKNLRELLEFTKDIDAQSDIRKEIGLLEKYQPTQLTEDQIRSFVAAIVGGCGDVPAAKKVGLMMGALNAHYKGQYDGKIASAIVKELI